MTVGKQCRFLSHYLFPITFLFGLSSSVALAQIPTGLSLEQVTNAGNGVVAIREAGDGTNRLFIVLRRGEIKILNTQTGGLLAQTFLNISSLVDDRAGEQGLLGLAFDPNYASNGFFYVNYTRDLGDPTDPVGDPKDRTVIARYSVSAGDANVANAGSALTVLEIEQDAGNHNGGDIHFGADGYLYIGMGDGGGGGDPNNRAQDKSELLGKMLRIDVNAPAGSFNDCGLNGTYGIPPGNPFTDGADGDCDEIWSLGLRNPWRWSFDRSTGDMFIGDVGQSAVEEISFQSSGVAGLNFGWDCKEGNQSFPGGSTCSGPLTNPILGYNHSLGCSVTGGYRYRGGYAPFFGKYVYGDFCTGRIWIATEGSPGNWSSTQWLDSVVNISTFGEDKNGNIYLADLNGDIYRIKTPTTTGGPPPGGGSGSFSIVPILQLLLD